MALDPEIKAKWLTDLRSGEYRQAQCHLHKDGGYCCLGVLCLSAGATFDDDGTYFENIPILDGENIADGENPELSSAFMRRIGLRYHEQKWLVSMNDEKNEPFAAIADYIEKNL